MLYESKSVCQSMLSLFARSHGRGCADIHSVLLSSFRWFPTGHERRGGGGMRGRVQPGCGLDGAVYLFGCIGVMSKLFGPHGVNLYRCSLCKICLLVFLPLAAPSLRGY